MTATRLPMKPLSYDDRMGLSGELEAALFWLQGLIDEPRPSKAAYERRIGSVYRTVAQVMQELIALPESEKASTGEKVN